MKWESTTIGQHCTVTSSKRFHLSERSNSGVPFYCSKEIIQKVNGEEVTECDYIKEEAYMRVKESFGVPRAGDLLITTRGTYGVPYIYKERDKFYFADGNLTWLKDFDDSLLSSFLYYWIRSHEGQKKIDAIAKGTAQKAVPISLIKDIPLSIPPIQYQQKIVDALSAYDCLIDNNQKQIKLLEEAAQRLYKEWFIDLRFPSHETTPIVKGIPEGWRKGVISEIVEYYDKIRKPLSSIERKSFQGKYKYYGAAGVLDHVKEFLYDGTFLLMGEDGTVIHPNGTPVLQYVSGKFWVNNHAHVLKGKKPYPTEFVYMMFNQLQVTDIVTGVAQPKISQARLSHKGIIIPSSRLILEYSKKTDSMFKSIILLSERIEILQQARNRLLPKLMSGEIEV